MGKSLLYVFNASVQPAEWPSDDSVEECSHVLAARMKVDDEGKVTAKDVARMAKNIEQAYLRLLRREGTLKE